MIGLLIFPDELIMIQVAAITKQGSKVHNEKGQGLGEIVGVVCRVELPSASGMSIVCIVQVVNRN